MANKKRLNDDAQKQPRDSDLNPFPGVTGEGAKPNVAHPTGGTTGGLYSDVGDGTIGSVGERSVERGAGEHTDETPADDAMASGTTGSPISAHNAGSSSYGTHRDTAGQMPHGQSGSTGAAGVGGMGSGTGRGRGGDTPGGVAGGDSSGTGGMGGGFDSQAGTGGASGGLAGDMGGGLTGGSAGQGMPRRSDVAGTGGGVAVSGGRGSDVGSVGGGMAPDLSPDTSGGMSGGTFGGSRESDLGGGLSGGMRSGTGTDVSGGVGDSDDETIRGDQQRSPRRRTERR